nr:stage II sporulation protein M [Desulfofundulus thermobenzoicus]
MRVLFLAELLFIKTAPSIRLVPALVLAVNGAVLSGACYVFWKSGASPALLAAGLVPHGVPKFSALFLACGAGMYGAAFERKAAVFRRTVVPYSRWRR